MHNHTLQNCWNVFRKQLLMGVCVVRPVDVTGAYNWTEWSSSAASLSRAFNATATTHPTDTTVVSSNIMFAHTHTKVQSRSQSSIWSHTISITLKTVCVCVCMYIVQITHDHVEGVHSWQAKQVQVAEDTNVALYSASHAPYSQWHRQVESILWISWKDHRTNEYVFSAKNLKLWIRQP